MTPKNVAKSTKVDRRLAAAAAPRTYTQIKLSQEMIFKLLLWKCSVSAVSPPCRCQQTWLPPWRVCLLFSALKTWNSNTRWVLQAVEVTPRRALTFMPSDDRETLTGDLPTHFLFPPSILLSHSTHPPASLHSCLWFVCCRKWQATWLSTCCIPLQHRFGFPFLFTLSPASPENKLKIFFGLCGVVAEIVDATSMIGSVERRDGGSVDEMRVGGGPPLFPDQIWSVSFALQTLASTHTTDPDVCWWSGGALDVLLRQLWIIQGTCVWRIVGKLSWKLFKQNVTAHGEVESVNFLRCQ